MNWRAVARREVRDAGRSRALWTVIALFAAVGAAAVVIPAAAIGGLSTQRGLAFLVAQLKLVVGLAGLLAGYGAVAGPRSGGQLKLTLGLPIERSALVVGAVLGRSVVVLAGTGVALTGIMVAFLGVYGAVPIARLAGFAAVLALFAVTVTAIAVGLSAASPSRGAAAVAAVGAFVLFEFFWGVVPGVVHYAVEGSLPGAVVPPWVVLLERLQPFAAFEAATDLVLPEAGQSVRLSAEGATAAGGSTRALHTRLARPPPTYLDPWVSIVTLVGWAVVPLAIGTYRFTRVDL